MSLHIRKIRLQQNNAYIAWTMFSASLLEKLDDFNLSEKDLRYLNSVKNNQRKCEILVTRILLNCVEPKAAIKYEKSGKPILENSSKNISISHSKNIAAIIVSENDKTAIDVQVFDEKVLGLRAKFLSAKELKQISKKDLQKNSLAWSVKESLFKSISEKNVPYKSCLSIVKINGGQVKCAINHTKIKKEVDVDYQFYNTFVMTHIV